MRRLHSGSQHHSGVAVRRATIVAGLLVTFLGAGCLPEEDDQDSGVVVVNESVRPPCVTSYSPGDQISVQLGVAYDAASDYWWDGSLMPGTAAEGTPSCAGVDGLQTGGTVTFTVVAASEGFSEVCRPFIANFQPETLTPIGEDQQPDLYGGQEPNLTGISIAVSFAQGTVIGAATAATRALFTPSMNPSGPLVARQPPPLAVTRELSWDRGQCFDAWIGTLGGSP
jgi:hypothetical protein